jgi:anti-sigma factor RsiW
MVKHISEEEISAWVDRQLDPGEAGRIESHLRGCGECHAAAGEMSAMAEAFRSTEIAELPPYLWDRIATNLDNKGSHRRADLRSWFLPVLDRPMWARASAAVLAVMVLAAGGTIFIEHRSAAELKERALLEEIQVARNSLAALDSETFNPFRTGGAASSKGNPFSRDQLSPDINPFRSAAGDR